MLSILKPVKFWLSRAKYLLKNIMNYSKNLKHLEFELIQSSGYVFQPTIAMTLTQDKCMSEEDALKEIHAKIFPGDTSSLKRN